MTPMLSPIQFAAAPLTDLVRALAKADPTDVPIVPGDVRLHGATVIQPSPSADTQPEDVRLPDDHPDVEIPGVDLESYLGGGGQGWVYAGRVRTTKKIVAVKVLSRGRDAQDWGAREAILCSRIRHRNVLRVLRAEPVGAFWVVLMELVIGDELGKANLRLDETRVCFGQLADALSAIARNRLIHRDVKPANVLLRRPDRSPVLIDFGLAIDMNETIADSADLCGTPFFMPPEAWRDGAPTPAWDAYALGVTAAIALAGSPDMPTDLPSLRQAKLSGVFERRLTRAIGDGAMREWIERMTAPEPAKRMEAVEAARGWSC
jgi:serine/threonine-protein kinase